MSKRTFPPEVQLTLLLSPVQRVKRGQVVYFGDYAKPYRVRRPKPTAPAPSTTR